MNETVVFTPCTVTDRMTNAALNEYWLISAPGDKTCQQTWDVLNNVTSKQNSLSQNYKFHIPDLKVGTLDVLVGLSDDLAKLDSFTEGVTRKISAYFADVLEDQKDKLAENLHANGQEISAYVTKFQWDMAKYPIKQPLRNLTEIISKQVSQIEGDLKNKASAYNNLKTTLQSMERKQVGSLLTRNVSDLVKKEDFVLNSEYLTTILVVVPQAAVKDWFTKYEMLTDMVVPQSSKKIFEDNEHSLVTVTMFHKVVDEFKHHAREHKFYVKDFVYNEDNIQQEKGQLTKLNQDKKKQYGPLVRWLKVNFSEAFSAYIHIKALRVFVESVLRYGLPVNFQAMLLLPNKRTSKKLRETLNSLYGHLDGTGPGGAEADRDDVASNLQATLGGAGGADFFPYVSYRIMVDFADTAAGKF